MDAQEIFCIYYPTTIVIVDDNKSILDNIELKIGKYIPCKTFSNPNEALAFLQDDMQQKDVLKNVMGLNENSEHYLHSSNQVPVQYDISKIYEHVNREDRFSEVSVLVVDYAMPGLSGEELCSQLRKSKNNPIKIIMLTGEADEPMAVKLFNLGIIDRFLMKSQPNVHEELKQTILAMQYLYFRDINYPLVRGISSDQDSSLSDPEFIKFFQKFIHDISASSYYLIEASGSFFLLDNAGKPTWLIVKSLNELEEIANQIEADISEELIDSIRNGEVVPYFASDDFNYYADEEKLKKCVYKATTLKSKKDYVYAILDEPPYDFPIKINEIQSLDDYLSKI